MTTDLRFGITLTDDIDAALFLMQFRAFCRLRGAVIYEERVREYIWGLNSLGLDMQLCKTLLDDPFNVTGVDDLCRWSEADLLDPARKGIREGRIRKITLALAKAGRALRDNEVIDYDDLVEHLDLSVLDYWTLRKLSRRISEVFLLDAVDLRQMGIQPSTIEKYLRVRVDQVLALDEQELREQRIRPETRATYERIQRSDRMLASLKPERTLADLTPGDYAAGIFEQAGIELTSLVCDLTEAGLRDGLRRSGMEGDMGHEVGWVRKLLKDFGVTLPS